MKSILDAARITLATTLIGLNTVVHAVPLLVLALFKMLVPSTRFRRACTKTLTRLAERWIAFNSALFDRYTVTRLVVEELPDLDPDGHYLVICNHQSWVDIPVLQKVFNRRIPLLRFFLKSQLIWVPLLGLAWWALDFPFMKRYSKEMLARRPELAGRDIETTRKACRKFRDIPVAVMNFVEGTRFSPARHAAQDSPYRHLLKPRAGGIAFVMDAMGESIETLLDVTISYRGPAPSLRDLLANRVREIRVAVRRREPLKPVASGSYENDPDYRERFRAWINHLWTEKDLELERMRVAND